MVVINRGKGNILLRTSDDFGTNDWESDEGTVSQNNDDENEKSKGIDSLDFDLAGAMRHYDRSIQRRENTLESRRPVSFMKNLSIEREGSTLVICLNSYKTNKIFGLGFGNTRNSGTITLSVADPVLKSLNAKSRAPPNIGSAIKVDEANVMITGSGNTTLGEVKSLSVKSSRIGRL